MDRLTSKQFKPLLDFLRAGYACHDQEVFVTHLLGGLSTLIPSEFTGYTEINHRTGAWQRTPGSRPPWPKAGERRGN